jgi:hypothetical protein
VTDALILAGLIALILWDKPKSEMRPWTKSWERMKKEMP